MADTTYRAQRTRPGDEPRARCPCVLLLDVSAIDGRRADRRAQRRPALAATNWRPISLSAQRVEVAVVTFGGRVETVCPFVVAEQFVPPTLFVNGDTPMGAAILHAIEQLAARKSLYKQQALPLFPAVAVSDHRRRADRRLVAGPRRGASGRGGPRVCVLLRRRAGGEVGRAVADRPAPAAGVDGLRFRDLFVWLSRSLRSVSAPGSATKRPSACSIPPGRAVGPA